MIRLADTLRVAHSDNRTHCHWRRHRRGIATLEWVLLLTLVLIGAVAGYAALGHVVVRQQHALDTSVEGMNFPADSTATAGIPAIQPPNTGNSH
jgi:hypothetical protein